MMKRLLSLLIVMAMLLTSAVPVFADAEPAVNDTELMDLIAQAMDLEENEDLDDENADTEAGEDSGIEALGTDADDADGDEDPDAASADADDFDYEPGVTVEEDEDSPTGYTVTFVYEDADAEKVVLYSDCFMLWDEQAPQYIGGSGMNLNSVSAAYKAAYGHTPDDYAPTYWPGGGSGSSRMDIELERVEGTNLWTTRLTLMSGAFVYNYQVTTDGKTISRLDDPANPSMVNEATGVRSLSSMVYVPYNAEKQGTGAGRDRSLELPREDGQTGVVETIVYPAYGGDDRGMTVYLPYGYDENREQPYNVLYINMGNSGDQFGNEMRWMHEGALPNIVDNLVAQGKEPFVAVSMNYQDWSHGWARIEPDVLEHVLPFVESNYNVATSREGRGYAGLSMGAATTARFYLNHPDKFSQFGIWSNGVTPNAEQLAKVAQYNDSTTVHIAMGRWDYVTAGRTLSATLEANGINHVYNEIPGGHDWELWQLLLSEFASEYLWENSAEPGDDLGVTVLADEASPTGYTVTFRYRGDDAQRVEVYSNQFRLFTIEELSTNSYPLDEFRPGMYPTNGEEGILSEVEYYYDLVLGDDGVWTTSLPLPSGAYVYNYQITDADGKVTRRLEDPANPTMRNPVINHKSLSSIIFVPYDEAKQGTEPWTDRSHELPRTDGQVGRLDYVLYQDVNDETRPLVVYLPDGYDADRAEPYKVLYLSSGASSDMTGNELRWFHEGNVKNIMDNLIADGRIEPFVVVTMDNNNRNYNYPLILSDLFGTLMPYVEANYNVADEASGRAYAGYSAGGMLTSHIFVNHPDEFGYFGILGGTRTFDLSAYEGLDQPTVMIGAGMWDFGLYSPSMGVGLMMGLLDDAGLGYKEVSVPGGHDWNTAQLLFTDMVTQYLWQDGGSDFAYEPGVTVEEDEDSPTGYTVTFVYESADAEKVVLYSDCFMLWDEQAPQYINGGGMNLNNVSAAHKAAWGHTPDDYAPTYWPGGGSGSSRMDIELERVEGTNLWTTQLTLMSGQFVYNYQITQNGTTTSRLDDPANPAMVNTATGVRSLSSLVHVPYNAEKQGEGAYRDRSLENPREDGQTGVVETIVYPAYGGTDRGMTVYLPYGYDENREQPYNVLYINMGNSGDQFGNEMRWMHEGALPNIVDNLVAQGKEPFVAVSMNYQDWSHGWARIEPDVLDHVLPFVEANYNVSSSREGRGYAGLSAGAGTTARFYLNHPDKFSQFGIWSNGVTPNAEQLAKVAQYNNSTTVHIALGKWDYVTGGRTMSNTLEANGIKHVFNEIPGGHDWEFWQLMLAEFASEYLWVDDGSDIGYEPGVTVEADENSPTGYTATFVYRDAAAQRVELYSDCFMHFTLEEGTTRPYAPQEYRAGMYPGGGSAALAYYVDLEKVGDDLWIVQVPLSSGAFVYNYQITDGNGVTTARLDDPANPTMQNTATGITSLSSMVYVPYNEEKMGAGDWVDRSVELPRTDGRTGTVDTVAYTGAAGDSRGLAVYLPHGYDENRAEPYKVLYLSHGGSSDRYGNELRWMNEGAVANIMDNLIADEGIEPFVVVTMNNGDTGWDYGVIETDMFEHIMPFVETNYNVSAERAGRAYAGLSMGGITTSNMYMNHPDAFSYYGIWSAAASSSDADFRYADDVHLVLGGGIWDYGLSAVDALGAKLTAQGIDFDYLTVPGAHDWETWQLMFADYARDYLWQAPEPVAPESIALSVSALSSMRKNATMQVAATVSPIEASQRVVWSSSNENVLTIDQNGLVTAHKVGSAIITATSADGTVTKMATIRVSA